MGQLLSWHPRVFAHLVYEIMEGGLTLLGTLQLNWKAGQSSKTQLAGTTTTLFEGGALTMGFIHVSGC